MPDIWKCLGTNCPYKESCYRFTSNDNQYQSYFMVPPIKDGKCDMYWGENAQNIWNQLKEIIK